MLLEGGLFGGACVISVVLYVAVMACLFSSRKKRNNRLNDASTHLIRAGEAFTDAAFVLLREEREDRPFGVVGGDGSLEEVASLEISVQPSNTNYEAISTCLSRIGTTLQKTGCMLQQGICPEESNQQSAISLDDRETVQILGKYTEVIELLNIARDSLRSAGHWLIEAAGGKVERVKDETSTRNNVIQKKLERLEDVIKQAGNILQASNGLTNESLSEAGKMLRDISTLISPELVPLKAPAQEHTSFRMKLDMLKERIPNMLFSVYRIVFRQSVEQVTIVGPEGTTRREYLFGGYGIPRRPWRLHAYYLAMLLIVANWFFVMFFDTAFYRKTTTCNDLNVRRDAYLCFDISKSITAGPTNCTDPAIRDDLDIHVLCYLQFFNFPIALSLSFSFAQLIIILIHISFAITLWCVTNYTPVAAMLLHAALCIGYVLFFLVYGPIVGANAVDNIRFEGTNLFYGDRILRMVMVLLGFFSLLLLTLLSPYYWLIDKYHREYCPTYGHEGKKKV